MNNQTNLAIPTDLIPKFEEWGKMTAQLFGELGQYKKDKDSFFSMTEELRAKFAGISETKINQLITEAVTAVRSTKS